MDWEARFSGPEGNGFVLGFPPGPPLSTVSPARSRTGSVRWTGARVVPGGPLVVSGYGEADEPVWANEPLWDPLLGEPR